MAINDLLDLDTFVRVKKASPQVTAVPFDMACWVVRAMVKYSAEQKASVDPQSQLYWTATLKSLHEYCHFDFEVSLNVIGRTVRAMGLESFRKLDGYHVAWSLAQLEILKTHFKA